MRNLTRFWPLFLVCFVLTGCSTAGGWNPLNLIFGRQAAAKEEKKQEVAQTEDAVVTAAQKEVAKTGAALTAAQKENPKSRAVAVAKRTNENAANLLNQRRPLTLADLQDAMATVDGLLSESVEARNEAERKQDAAEKDNRQLSEELGKLRAKVEELDAKAAAEAAKNLATANELRAANIWKWAGTAGTVLFGIGMFLYRNNAFGMATRFAGGLVELEKKHGPETADLARGMLDAALDSGDKNKIFTALKTIAPNIAHRVAAS